MFDVIDALEALGADSELAGAPSARLDAMLERAGAQPVIRSALLAGDTRALERLLRAPPNICAFIHPAEEEEMPVDEEENEEGEDDLDDDVESGKGPKPRG